MADKPFDLEDLQELVKSVERSIDDCESLQTHLSTVRNQENKLSSIINSGDEVLAKCLHAALKAYRETREQNEWLRQQVTDEQQKDEARKFSNSSAAKETVEACQKENEELIESIKLQQKLIAKFQIRNDQLRAEQQSEKEKLWAKQRMLVVVTRLKWLDEDCGAVRGVFMSKDSAVNETCLLECSATEDALARAEQIWDRITTIAAGAINATSS